MPGQFALDLCGYAYQQNSNTEFTGRQHRSLHLGARSKVATHSIHSDGNHLRAAPGVVSVPQISPDRQSALVKAAIQAEVSITSRPL